MKKKVSDIIVEFIVSKGINKVFLLTGGGIMHLTDSIGKYNELEYICNYHEQACAIAAEGYARVTGKPGVCFGTTGPGIVNALSGVIGAWHDSIPMLVFGGQVRTSVMADFNKIRQLGPQEGNVVEIAKPMTKYAVKIIEPKTILYELNKAYNIATSGRPGPVYIEVPLDIQAAEIDYENLVTFINKETEEVNPTSLNFHVKNVIEILRNSKYPILFPGNGIRIGDAFNEWREFVNLLNIPVVLPYTAKDLLAEDDLNNMGVIGTNGQRRANFAVQNSDLFISLASGISTSKIGFNSAGFAPKAKKIIVDIDEGQVFFQSVKGDVSIIADIKQFLSLAIKELNKNPYLPNHKWKEICKYWKIKYPLLVKEYYDDKKHVNMYVFSNTISNFINENEIIVCGNGFDCASVYQVFNNKTNQRILISGNWGAMGWDLPTAVGSCIANDKKRTILITGDGSIMLNIQELLTISTNKLPIKIFIFNNKGYASIRATQNNLLNNHLVGSDFNTGISNPNFEKLANSFGLNYYYINNNEKITEISNQIFNNSEPSICEVNLAYDIFITPKALAFKKADGTMESKPLEDMFPFLPKDEVDYNMNLINQ